MSRPRAVEIVEARADGTPLDRTLRISIHFHPDQVTDGRTVLEHLVTDRTYRTQFETATSNGGLTAHPGGDRWRWESRLFAGLYDDAPAADRPRYGALNHRRRRVGGAPRFGSAHLRLSGPVLDRATFCFPDSVFEPTAIATADRFGLWPLVENFESIRRGDQQERTEGGLLDDYVEAHVHGGLDLDSDVEAIVLDPAHSGTEHERTAERLGVAVEWHDGFRVHVDTLAQHPDFRGPEVVELARQVALQGWLDPVALERARRVQKHDRHQLKLLWHCIARFGSDWT